MSIEAPGSAKGNGADVLASIFHTKDPAMMRVMEVSGMRIKRGIFMPNPIPVLQMSGGSKR